MILRPRYQRGSALGAVDIPWAWDKQQHDPDVHGWCFPRSLAPRAAVAAVAAPHHVAPTANTIRWAVRLQDRWQDYPEIVSARLEAAFRQDQQAKAAGRGCDPIGGVVVSGVVPIGDAREVDLRAMRQQVVGQRWRSRQVQRIVGSE